MKNFIEKIVSFRDTLMYRVWGGKGRTLEEHEFFAAADFKRMKQPSFMNYILKNERYFMWHFWYHLRKVEFYHAKKGLFRLLYLWHWYRYKHYCWTNKWTIRPFTIGPGAQGLHVGDFVYIGEGAKVGSNFTFGQGVILAYGCDIEIGDNVMIYPGVKIVKSVKIGDNVIIGANSVVTHDIPSNSVAYGVPAKSYLR